MSCAVENIVYVNYYVVEVSVVGNISFVAIDRIFYVAVDIVFPSCKIFLLLLLENLTTFMATKRESSLTSFLVVFMSSCFQHMGI